MENEMMMQIAQLLEDQTARIQKMLDAQTAQLNLKIENDVSRKLQALTDGYKLTHEKQWELERRTEQLQQQIEEMQTRLAILEEKTA